MLWYLIKDEPLRLVMTWCFTIKPRVFKIEEVAVSLGIEDTLANAQARKLVKTGVLKKIEDKTYQVDTEHPLYPELRGLFLKSGIQFKKLSEYIQKNDKIKFCLVSRLQDKRRKESFYLYEDKTLFLVVGEFDYRILDKLNYPFFKVIEMTRMELEHRYMSYDGFLGAALREGVVLKNELRIEL